MLSACPDPTSVVPEDADHAHPRLLKLLRAAAGPHTKLLWVDNMLAYACVDEESGKDGSADEFGAVRSLVPADSPLLPNLGRASSNGYILDIQVRLRSLRSHRFYPGCGLRLKSC